MKNFITIFFSLILAFILCEILLRFFYPQNLVSAFFFQNKDGLYLNKNFGVAKHKSVSNNKVSYYYFTHPHLRVAKKDMNMNLNKIENKILILGTSTHFGWFLDYKETFVGIINDYLKQNKREKTKLLNPSVGGWGNASKLSYLKEFSEQINPNYAIVFINQDEFGASYNNSLYYIDKNELKKGKRPVNKIKTFVNKFKIYHFLIENSHLMNFVRVQMLKIKSLNWRNFHIEKELINYSNFESNNFEKALYKGKKIFEEMIVFATKNNIEIIFIYDGFARIENFDSSFSVIFKENKENENEKNPTAYFIKKEASTFFKKNNVRFINLNSYFWKETKDASVKTFCEKKGAKCITENKKNIMEKYFFSDGAHPNAKFNKIFADTLLEELPNIF